MMRNYDLKRVTTRSRWAQPIIFVCLLLATGLWTTNLLAQCTNTSSFGSAVAPTGATATNISTCSFQSEYSTITSVVAGNRYVVTGSIAGAYITMRFGTSSGQVVAAGVTPLQFTAPCSGTYFAHWNTNSACGTAGTCMTTTIACSSCGAAANQCTNVSAFGSAVAPSVLNTPTTITTCAFAQEYSTITSVDASRIYTVTGSIAGTFLTVRSGSSGGPVVASGGTPLTFSPTVAGTYFLHYNTNSACGTASTCITGTISYIGNSPCAFSPPTISSFTPNTNLCAAGGQTITITGTNFTGATSVTFNLVNAASFVVVNSTTITAVTPSGLTAGVINVTNPAGNVNSAAYTVVASPTVIVSPSSSTICSPGGGAVTLTVTGTATSFAWSPTAGLTPTTGNPVSALPASSTTYTVTGTDGNGCTASATSSLTVNTGVTLTSVTASPSSVCSGSNSILTANLSIPSLTYCASTHANGCSGDDITNVVLNTLSNPTTGCGGVSHYTYFTGGGSQTTTLSNAGSPYNCTVSFGTDGSQFFGAWIDYNQNGTFEVGEFLGASGNAGSSGTISVSFTVPPGALNGITRLRIVGGNDSPVTSAQPCGASSSSFGETQDYNVTITGGIDPFTFAWSPSTFLSSTTTNPTTAVAVTSNQTYQVLVTATNGCTATGTTSITAGSALSCGAITSSSPICSGSNFTLTSNTSGGGAPYTYLWSESSTTANITQNLAAGSYTYTVTVTDACAATCSTSITVAVNPTPTASITPAGPITVCTNNLPTVLTANTSATTPTYVWKNNGTAIVPAETNATLNVTTSGNYSVVVTDGSCSAESSPVSVTVVTSTAPPTAGPSTITVCQGALSSASFTGNCTATGSQTSTSSGATGLPITWTSTQAATSATLPVSAFPPGSTTTNVSVTVNINHTWGGDILMTLQAPNGGPTLNVLNDPLDNNLDFGSAGGVAPSLPYTFNMTGVALPTSGAVASPGPYLPASSFAGYNGFDPNGIWTLTVSDGVSGDGGTVELLDLTITANTIVAGPADWYSVPTGGTLITSTSSFNAITDGGVNTATPGTTNFYAECPGTNGCPSTRTQVSFIVNAPPVVTCGGTDVSCNGGSNGSANVGATGNGPFTYLWSNTNTNSAITGLTAGTYCVTVTDVNGCTATCCYTVTEPTVLSATATSTNASCPLCPDGTVTISSVSGGTPSYTFTNLTGLLPGNYCITVTDANGCTTSACATVGAAGCTLAANMTLNNNVPCFGGVGSATVTPGGSFIGPFSYLWDNGNTNATASNLNAGNHTVILSDLGSGCVTQGNITITQPNVLTAGCSGTNVSCFGGSNGSASVVAGGGTAPYSYLWSTTEVTSSIGGLTPGTYCVTVTDANGCTATCCYSVTQPSAPLSVTGTVVNVVCAESPTGSITITPTGGTSPYSYLWSTSSTSQNLTSVASGTYTVTVTDANGCTASYTNTVNCTDNIPPTLSVGPGSGTPLFENFEAGILPLGWSATGLWHVTAACLSGTPPNPTKWAYYGQDATCTFNNGGTNSGDLTSPTVSIPGSATSAKVRFRYAYNGEGGSPPSGFDNAAVKISVNGGAFVQAAPLSSTGSAGAWLAAEFNIPSAIGGTIALQWNFSTQDGIANDFLGLQVDSVAITYVNLQQCPSDIVTTNAPGQCGNNVSWTPPVASDNCAVTLTSNKNPGDFFNIGTTAVTYTATDGCGNVTTCSFNVTVTDNENPVITCPGTITTDCNGVATYSVTATDNCSATTALFGGLASGSTFPVGNTTVTWSATDPSGNVVFCSFLVVRNAPVTVTETHTNVLCNGGSTGTATANASGGVPPYTYLWSDAQVTQTAVGLIAGSYSVVVTDADGCTGSVNVTITEPAVYSVSTTQTNVSCFGGSDGSATAVPAGGTPASTYLWSNGSTNVTATGLSAGTYMVTATDANGCVSNSSAIISQPPQVFLTENHVDVSCFQGGNGSIDLSVAGGTGPFSYLWSNGATTEDLTNVTASTYFVTVTEGNGCTAVLGVTVSSPTVIASGITVVNVTCFSAGSVSTNATGGTPGYTYVWSNGATTSGITGLTAGTYTVTITDANGCTISKSKVVSLTNTLVVTATGSNSSCGLSNGTATATASGGTAPYSFLWSNGQTTATATGIPAGSIVVTVTDAFGCSKTATAVIANSNGLGVKLTSPVYQGGKNVSCNGACDGSATATGLYSPGPYTYIWNTGATTQTITGLCAGIYTVTISNGGCTATGQITLKTPAALAITFTKVNVSCFGDCNGTATANKTGGTNPVTYSWNTIPVQNTQTATGLCAGSYTVTITDANGCTKSATTTITQPNAALSVTGVVTNLNCNNVNTGTITLTTTGGTSPYTYLWSTGSTSKNRTGLAAGTYTVTVTDSKGCTTTAVFTVTQPAALVVTTSKTNVSCNGGNDGTATANASGGTPGYTYSWSTVPVQTTATATGLTAGSKTCTVTDSKGCTKTVSVTINQPAAITISTTQVNVTLFGGNNGTATANASGGTSPYTYSWNTAPAQNTQTATGLAAGTYTVTVTDANGCTKTKTVTITQPGPRLSGVGSDEISSIQVYPNPNNGMFKLSFESNANYQYQVIITDVTGRQVLVQLLETTIGANLQSFDLSTLPKGVYIMQVNMKSSHQIIKVVLE